MNLEQIKMMIRNIKTDLMLSKEDYQGHYRKRAKKNLKRLKAEHTHMLLDSHEFKIAKERMQWMFTS